MYQTLRVLAQKADVRVFHAKPRYVSEIERHTRPGNHAANTYQPEGVQASYYEFPALPLLSRPFNGRILARTLMPDVRAFRPDLVLGCFLYPDGYAAVKIARSLSVPVAVMSIGSDINRIGDPVSAMLTRSVVREADFVLTVSGDLREKAIHLGALRERTRAIVNGCDLSVFHVKERDAARQKLGIESSVKAVLYVGRIDVRKGLRELVESTAMLKLVHPRLHTYIVGQGPDIPILEKAIRGNRADESIHIIRGCEFNEVAEWMAAADVVTLPSYMEGCPNVVLEALACGRPVVASNVGGIPEILSDQCGRLVLPGHSVDLACALGAVLEREWDAGAISAEQSRSWEDVAAELLEVFEFLESHRIKQKTDEESLTLCPHIPK